MTDASEPRNSKFSGLKKVDYRVVSVVLLLVILLLILLWHPWAKTLSANSRTVQVTGESTVKSEPDEFVFYPSYKSANTDSQASLAELSKKSDEIVAKLKSLGVRESNIKTNASSNDGKYMVTMTYPNPEESSNVLQLTVTIDNRGLAQKVQDYLVTTGPTGSVSPSSTFSTAKQKQLQNQARDEATKDAKAKAEQTAKNLGFKLGAVKTVEDQAGFDRMMPVPMSTNMESGAVAVSSVGATAGSAGTIAVSPDAVKTARFPVLPGQDQVTYSVKVTYFVK